MANETNLNELNNKLDQITEKEDEIKKTITELQYKKTTITKEIDNLKIELSEKYQVSSSKELQQLYEEKLNDINKEIENIELQQEKNSEIVKDIKNKLEKLENDE